MKHFSSSQFEAYFRGELGGSEAKSLLAHLSDCDRCLDASQAAWEEVSPLSEGWPEPSDGPLPDLSQLERRTFRQVHLRHLVGDSLSFLVLGVGVVFAVLLRPFGSRDSTDQQDDSRRP